MFLDDVFANFLIYFFFLCNYIISEYVDEAALICKQTAVLVQRVPGLPRKPIVVERDE